jgi:hypothetical protein
VFLLETIINPIIPCEDEDEDEDEDKDSKFVKYCKTETANKVESIVSILYDILLNKKDVITDYDRALLHTKTGLTVEQWELKEKEKEKEEKDDPGTTRYNLRGFLSKSTPNYQINKTCSLIIELLKLAPTIKEDRGKTEELKKLLNKLKEDLRKFGCEENLTIHDL